MKHVLRKQFLQALRKTPFEELVKDVILRLSSGQGARYDKETFQVMQRCLVRDSNCIDVGAYRGDILRRMIAYAPEGEIHAIEPIAENSAYLQKRFPTVQVHNVALSDKPGQAIFYHVLGRPARSGLEKQAYPDPQENVAEITVTVNTLDQLISGQTPVHFIKVDVEGAEAKVLQGGIQLIKKWRPVIVFEHAEPAALKFGVTSDQLFAFLTGECGLHVSTMRKWLDDEAPFTRDEFHRAREKQEIYFVAY